MNDREIIVLSSPEELSRAAAKKFVDLAQVKISAGYSFKVALAGGSTPKRLYELLADENEPFRGAVDWKRIDFFWGDERCVPPDSSESNFLMADDSLLKPLGISPTNIHRFKSELEPKAAAEDYETLLRLFFNKPKGSFPAFDLILLGMGEDGHTASLFPKSDALYEDMKLVASPFVEQLNAFRLTLTPGVLNNAENIIFQVAGENKAAVLRDVLQGDSKPKELPAQIVNPRSGKVFWFLDEAAAQLLTVNRQYENFSGYLRR